MNVTEILEKLSQMNLLRLDRPRNNWYTVYCPFHNNGNERKPSCGVLLEDEYKNGELRRAGQFHCFACGVSKSMPDAVEEILRLKNITSITGVDWLKENIPGFDTTDLEVEQLIPDSLMKSINSSYAVNYIRDITHDMNTYVSEEELKSYRFTVPYMYERGLTDELIEKYDIGFDANHVPEGRKKALPCITFPIRDLKGRTLFFCRRSVEGKYFNYPTGITKPVYGIYELPKDVRSVVICESCLNALTSTKYGRPAVALLGTGNPYQIEQLKRLGAVEFILALDPDGAGRKGTARLKHALREIALIWEFDGIPDGKDINDLTKEEFDNLDLR